MWISCRSRSSCHHTSCAGYGTLPWTTVSKALVPCRQFSGNFVIRAPVSSVHYVMLQFPLLVHAWNMCVPTIQAKWRTFPMTISYHSSLMQTQPFLFYQFVDVYHAVAAFGLSNIVTNFVTLCFYFSYCHVYVHTVHTPSGSLP